MAVATAVVWVTTTTSVEVVVETSMEGAVVVVIIVAVSVAVPLTVCAGVTVMALSELSAWLSVRSWKSTSGLLVDLGVSMQEHTLPAKALAAALSELRALACRAFVVQVDVVVRRDVMGLLRFLRYFVVVIESVSVDVCVSTRVVTIVIIVVSVLVLVAVSDSVVATTGPA